MYNLPPIRQLVLFGLGGGLSTALVLTSQWRFLVVETYFLGLVIGLRSC
jgi:hypothetical protein